MEEAVPPCPYCQNAAKAVPVSQLVAEAFPLPPGDYATIVRDYKPVSWAGSNYYLPRRFFISNDMAPQVANFSLAGILKSLSAVQTLQHRYWLAHLEKLDPPPTAQELTALWLLPVALKPAPLPARTGFLVLLLELFLISLRSWRVYLPFLVLLPGLLLNLWPLVSLGWVLVAYYAFSLLAGTVLLKLGVLMARRLRRDYRRKQAKNSQAVARWQALFYCPDHDGAFGPDTPFLPVNRVQAYLFEE